MAQGKLVLCRRAGEKVILTIDPDADPQEALRWLLEEGIEISVAGFTHGGKTVRLGIRAPREVLVLRGELEGRPYDQKDHPATEDVSNG